MAKAKKSKTKKSKKAPKAKIVKKKKKAAKAVKAKAPVKTSAKKSKAVKKAKPAKKVKAKKAAPKKKKQIVGEGDYAATRKFDKDQADFVKKNKARIPELAKEAEKALDGPEGDGLRAAEQEARDRSTM